MFCENCGRKSTPGEKFCADCGTVLRNNVANQNVKKVTKKKPKTGLIVGLILGFFGLMVAGIVGIVFIALSFLNKYEVKNYIKLGSDKIPTIYSAVGRKDILSVNSQYSNNEQTVKIEYYTEDFSDDDFDGYYAFLIKDGFSSVENSSNLYMYVKDSKETGKVLFIYINKDYNNDTLIVDYAKAKGDISDYEVETNPDDKNIRVGKEGYGFIDMPSNAIIYDDKDDTTNDIIQYSDEDSSFLLTLSTLESTEYSVTDYIAYYADDYEKQGATVKLGNVTLDGYNAYTIAATFSNGWISKEWLFADENNKLYYIYLGTYDNVDIFDYISTYKIES